MKSLLLIAIISVCFSGFSQPSLKSITSDKLFGYTGTKQSTGIKPNEITLTTPKGDVLKFVKVGNYITFVPKNENEVVKRVRKKMPASKKQKETLEKTAISKKGPAYYTITQQMVNEHEVIDKAYENVTSNKISLSDPFQRGKEENKITSAKEEAAPPEWMKTRYQEIINYAKSIEGNQSFNLPAPPALDFACNLCQKDSANRNKSETTRKAYSEEVFKQENDALQDIIKIQRAYYIDLGEPASMKTMIRELDDARTVIFQRVKLKCSKLLNEFGSNLEALLTIIPVVLQKERERQLMAAGDAADEINIMVKVAELFSAAAVRNFIEKKLQAKDFRYIINPAPLISLVRQSMLLGNMDEYEYLDLIDKIIDNNRFEFRSTIEIKRTFAGKDGDHFMEGVFVSDPFYYMVAETPDCRLVLVPDTGYQTVFSKNRLMSYEIKSIRNTECSYSGPKRLELPSPVIHLDFCADTAQLEFAFDTDWAGYEEKWSCSYGSDGDLVENLLSEGYNNRVDDQESQMNELTNNDKEKGFKQMISGKDPRVTNLEEMKQHYPESIKTSQKSYDFRKFIKRVPVVNFQSTIIEEKLNGKETHDADDERFEYAWLRIRLEHAPKTNPTRN